MTITEVAERIGVTSKTIVRWERSGKVRRAKRDWRGWRFYELADFEELLSFRNAVHYC